MLPMLSKSSAMNNHSTANCRKNNQAHAIGRTNDFISEYPVLVISVAVLNFTNPYVFKKDNIHLKLNNVKITTQLIIHHENLFVCNLKKKQLFITGKTDTLELNIPVIPIKRVTYYKELGIVWVVQKWTCALTRISWLSTVCFFFIFVLIIQQLRTPTS